MLLFLLTVGITAAADECRFNLVICDSIQQECGVTFDRAEVAMMAANELNTKVLMVITGILLVIITCAAPTSISTKSIEKSLQLDSDPFFITEHCIL